MQNFIYLLWASIPLFFFLLALWHSLQKGARSSAQRKEEIKDLYKQGAFVSICVVVTYFTFHYIYMPYISPEIVDLVPDFVAQVLLLPVVLYIAAIAIGPTKAIRISKPPALRSNTRRRK